MVNSGTVIQHHEADDWRYIIVCSTRDADYFYVYNNYGRLVKKDILWLVNMMNNGKYTVLHA